MTNHGGLTTRHDPLGGDMFELTINDTGTLHVLDDGKARLDWTDPRDGALVAVTTDAVVELHEPDKPVSALAPAAFDGTVLEAGARLEPGTYPVTFHVPAERAWDTRRHGRVYGTVEEVSGEWTTVRLTRTHQRGEVGQTHTMRECLTTEVTAQFAAGAR